AIAIGWATLGPPPMTLAQQRDFLRHLGKHERQPEDPILVSRHFVNQRVIVDDTERPCCGKRPLYCRCGDPVARLTPPA
ncbi:hypothetical protein RA264_28130, partial [Pseudomonas syringae pv. tagetis]|uniref:hypothetical protein n=1 Tax=Pseudomonas syringae group genomosp. 7 TaxID=251699 RepID=UPI00376F7243